MDNSHCPSGDLMYAAMQPRFLPDTSRQLQLTRVAKGRGDLKGAIRVTSLGTS
jgi:hypothetical protein